MQDACVEIGGSNQQVQQCIQRTLDQCNGASLVYMGMVMAYGHEPYINGQISAACIALKTLKTSLDCPN
jgi:hypothetical protein